MKEGLAYGFIICSFDTPPTYAILLVDELHREVSMYKTSNAPTKRRRTIPLFLSGLTALLLLSGCSGKSSSIGIIGGADGPTAIFVTGGGEEPQRTPYTPVLSPIAEEDGRLIFTGLMQEGFPYIALGTEIRLPGENLTVADYLLKEDGRVRYNDGNGGPLGQEIELEQDEDGTFFTLPSNMATALSSHTADYAPGAAIRGFLVTDGEGSTTGFVIRTDPGFLIEEISTGEDGSVDSYVLRPETWESHESNNRSVSVVGGVDGPTSIEITVKPKNSEN